MRIPKNSYWIIFHLKILCKQGRLYTMLSPIWAIGVIWASAMGSALFNVLPVIPPPHPG